MKYMISRTSDWSDTKPCEEAFKDSFIIVDERNVDSPEKLRYKLNTKEWYKEGKNHRVEGGHIKRDFEYKRWFVNINTLEELNKFIDKYGNVVIGTLEHNKELKEIEIYDEYRE